MGKYFVSRESYDVLLDRVTFLEELLDKRFSISVPYITIDGVGEIQIIGEKDIVTKLDIRFKDTEVEGVSK